MKSVPIYPLAYQAEHTKDRPEESSADSSSRSFKVGGYTPFTATDYPGKLAAVVFVQGCPWRCGYCHNPHLQARTVESALSWTALREALKRRVGLIDAVVFSGGEPTADPFLLDAILDVRELGFAVGLHTGGAYSKRLKEVLPHVDWVGFDIKTNPEQYDDLTKAAHSGEQAFLGAEAVLASGVDYEFRTTIHPSLHSASDILRLGHRVAAMGCKNYALQLFRDQGCADMSLNGAQLGDYPGEVALAELLALFASFVVRRN